MAKFRSIVTFSLIFLCFVGLSNVCFKSAKAQFQGDIVINSDGSITPSSAPILKTGTVYTSTSDVAGIIVVQASNITLDGNGNSVISIFLSQTMNVTVRDFIVASRNELGIIGISMNNVSNCLIYRNNVTGFWSIQAMNGIDFGGIQVIDGTYNVFAENYLVDNLFGMEFVNSTDNVITQNTVISNHIGAHLPH